MNCDFVYDIDEKIIMSEIPQLNDITLSMIDNFVEKRNLKNNDFSIFDSLTSEEYILKGWEVFCKLVDVEKLQNGNLKEASIEIADIVILKDGLLNGITKIIQNKEEYKPAAFFYETSLWDGAYPKQSLFPMLFKKQKTATLRDIFDDFLLHLVSEDLNSFDRDSYYAIIDGEMSMESHLSDTFGKDYNNYIDTVYGNGICNKILSYYNHKTNTQQIA